MSGRVISESEIREAIAAISPRRLIEIIEQGFVSHSSGRTVVPPIAEMSFDTPPGDVHVKYGYLLDDPCYVIKIASGFYDNPERGLLVSQGMMLVFDRTTGVPLAILLDNGYLTRIRTAVAGAIAAKWLAPTKPRCIGIVGTGVQARLQLKWLGPVVDQREVLVLSRSPQGASAYVRDMGEVGFDVSIAKDARDLGQNCDLVITTTPSKEPLLHVDDVRLGTHITAMGSDTMHKQELDPAILGRAEVVVADSREQARVRGEIAHALRRKTIDEGRVLELGDVIAGKSRGRTSNRDITVADLTGVAVQDIQIAKAVCSHLGV
ncbi:MAG: ornithine cyclodeaminase family protein, partial [Actinomycetota bacterium]|nr:ornithine cyclodeaminase family protein [Actinomycetota bacterium]